MGLIEIIKTLVENLEPIQALVLGVPALVAAVGGGWAWGRAWIKARAKELEEAEKGSWWQAAQYLWALGQQLKARLDLTGSRADFGPQLRAMAPEALRLFGLDQAQGDKLLELARAVHKMQKTFAPQNGGAEGNSPRLPPPTSGEGMGAGVLKREIESALTLQPSAPQASSPLVAELTSPAIPTQSVG